MSAAEPAADVPVPELSAALERLAAPPDDAWIRSLDPRKREELEFHDEDRERAEDGARATREPGNRRFYSVVGASQAYVEGWIRTHAPGRVFLDYACGNGAYAIQAAAAGASLAIGLDISGVSVRNAARDAEAAGVGRRTRFVQGDCEATRLPSGSVDVVVCSGVLHHLDLGYAFPELRRILRPAGTVLAVEALAVNPLIALYRRLTPGLRTDWERKHILSHRHLRFARWFFEVRNVRYWHLFVLPAALAWGTPLFGPLARLGGAMDAVAMRLPLVNRLAWQFTFELHKPH
ncbi:MAG TPA: class I SAM-dependent methyltransferase [Longimicrobiales bacterium]|nr:class I SAM-dependent methyltransferase [Longimicrobiales bacterium]